MKLIIKISIFIVVLIPALSFGLACPSADEINLNKNHRVLDGKVYINVFGIGRMELEDNRQYTEYPIANSLQYTVIDESVLSCRYIIHSVGVINYRVRIIGGTFVDEGGGWSNSHDGRSCPAHFDCTFMIN